MDQSVSRCICVAFGAFFLAAFTATGQVGGGPPTPLWFWKLSEFELTLQRLGCYGTCAEFDLSIGGDGIVRYAGIDHVAVTGQRSWKISREQLKLIVEKVFKAGFFDTRAEKREYELTFLNPNEKEPEQDAVIATRVGNLGWVDTPKVRLNVRIGEVEQEVVVDVMDRHEKHTWQLAREIEQVVGSDRWVRGEPNERGHRTEGESEICTRK